MKTTKKMFRVSDKALVVYKDDILVGVKHREVSSWLVWSDSDLRWQKAQPDDAKDFETLPLTGSVEN